jgi:hypothetical protein
MIDHLADLRMSGLVENECLTVDEYGFHADARTIPTSYKKVILRARIHHVAGCDGNCGNPPVPQDSDTTQINLPTDEQVERAARLLCVARGENQEPTGKLANDTEWIGWKYYEEDAREHLILILNKDRILGYR